MEKNNLHRGPKKFTEKRAKLVEDIDKHNRAVEAQHTYFMTAAPLAELTQALMVLNLCNHTTSLSIHDEQWSRLDYFSERPNDLQIIANAIKLSRYPLSAVEIHLTTVRVSANNIQPADIFWERMIPIPNITIMLRPESHDEELRGFPAMVTKILSNGTHLEIGEQCFISKDYRKSNPVFGEHNYGALHGYIRNKSFHKVTMCDVDAHYDFLSQDLNLKPEYLQSLELTKISFAKHFDERGWLCTSLSFFRHLKTLVRLDTLILEKITGDGSRDIQKKSVEWSGQEEIQGHLDDLIAMETYKYI
ncbi:hypothetical protein E4T43_03723 [Aureobasidium subglaciale]|nr:hypothetical protein E4T43_03723 [Aureobasidium subglaciale]